MVAACHVEHPRPGGPQVTGEQVVDSQKQARKGATGATPGPVMGVGAEAVGQAPVKPSAWRRVEVATEQHRPRLVRRDAAQQRHLFLPGLGGALYFCRVAHW